MLKPTQIIRTLLFSISMSLTFHVQAAYPDKPIKIIIGFPAGGPLDAHIRLLVDKLQSTLGQTVIVDYKAGAGGTVGAQFVAQSLPDGYTLLLANTGTMVINPAIYTKAPYDTLRDFQPIARTAQQPLALIVNKDVPANSLKELIAYAKANPGKLNYASQGNGSVSHIGTEIFKQTTGVDMVHVPYKGSGPAVQDVLAGQVQVFITTPPSVMQHVQSGKLKGLAVTGKNRHPGMPNVPTTAEAGLASFQLESWVALYAPAGTPAPVVSKLTDSVKKSLALPEIKERADAAGVELRYLNPPAMDALLKKELPYWYKAIKSANITLD